MRLDRAWDQFCFAVCLEAMFNEVCRIAGPATRDQFLKAFVQVGREIA